MGRLEVRCHKQRDHQKLGKRPGTHASLEPTAFRASMALLTPQSQIPRLQNRERTNVLLFKPLGCGTLLLCAARANQTAREPFFLPWRVYGHRLWITSLVLGNNSLTSRFFFKGILVSIVTGAAAFIDVKNRTNDNAP